MDSNIELENLNLIIRVLNKGIPVLSDELTMTISNLYQERNTLKEQLAIKEKEQA